MRAEFFIQFKRMFNIFTDCMISNCWSDIKKQYFRKQDLLFSHSHLLEAEEDETNPISYNTFPFISSAQISFYVLYQQ